MLDAPSVWPKIPTMPAFTLSGRYIDAAVVAKGRGKNPDLPERRVGDYKRAVAVADAIIGAVIAAAVVVAGSTRGVAIAVLIAVERPGVAVAIAEAVVVTGVAVAVPIPVERSGVVVAVVGPVAGAGIVVAVEVSVEGAAIVVAVGAPKLPSPLKAPTLPVPPLKAPFDIDVRKAVGGLRSGAGRSGTRCRRWC